MGYTINDKTKQITLIRGDTLKMQVSIFINKQPYIPASGDVIRFAMKQSMSSSKVLIHKEIPNDTLMLHLLPSDTKRLAFGNYVYDIEITFENGDVDTFITGKLTLKPEVE